MDKDEKIESVAGEVESVSEKIEEVAEEVGEAAAVDRDLKAEFDAFATEQRDRLAAIESRIDTLAALEIAEAVGDAEDEAEEAEEAEAETAIDVSDELKPDEQPETKRKKKWTVI